MRNKLISRLTLASMIGVGAVTLAFACQPEPTTPAPIDMAKGPPDIADPPIPPDLRMPPPVLTSVAPAVIVNTGGMITITGQNFQTGATVTVGGTACANPTVTATQITCTAPAKAAMCGVQNIVVTNPDTQTVTSTPAMGLTYRTNMLGFAPGSPVSYATGTFPRRIITADFNGDGKPDLASANQIGNNVTLRLGAGDGTFPNATSVNIPNGAGATTLNDLVAGDWNGDNKMDLAVANGSNNVTIFLNMGASFTTTVVNTGISGGAITAGDINGDNKIDLIVGGNSTNIVPLINNGGTFTMGTLKAAPGTNGRVALADMNGDGKLDLITANQSTSNVSVFLGAGNGTFGNAASQAVGATPTGMAVLDVNGDKKMDVVTGNNMGMNVSVLIGDGAGGLAATVNTALGTNRPEIIAAADMNNDGLIDIVTANANNNNTSYLQGMGAAGTQFAAAVVTAMGTTPAGVVIGDFNADGLKDVAFASAGPPAAMLVNLQVCK